jgi:hypothetical protein
MCQLRLEFTQYQRKVSGYPIRDCQADPNVCQVFGQSDHSMFNMVLNEMKSAQAFS